MITQSTILNFLDEKRRNTKLVKTGIEKMKTCDFISHTFSNDEETQFLLLDIIYLKMKEKNDFTVVIFPTETQIIRYCSHLHNLLNENISFSETIDIHQKILITTEEILMQTAVNNINNLLHPIWDYNVVVADLFHLLTNKPNYTKYLEYTKPENKQLQQLMMFAKTLYENSSSFNELLEYVDLLEVNNKQQIITCVYAMEYTRTKQYTILNDILIVHQSILDLDLNAFLYTICCLNNLTHLNYENPITTLSTLTLLKRFKTYKGLTSYLITQYNNLLTDQKITVLPLVKISTANIDFKLQIQDRAFEKILESAILHSKQQRRIPVFLYKNRTSMILSTVNNYLNTRTDITVLTNTKSLLKLITTNAEYHLMILQSITDFITDSTYALIRNKVQIYILELPDFDITQVQEFQRFKNRQLILNINDLNTLCDTEQVKSEIYNLKSNGNTNLLDNKQLIHLYKTNLSYIFKRNLINTRCEIFIAKLNQYNLLNKQNLIYWLNSHNIKSTNQILVTLIKLHHIHLYDLLEMTLINKLHYTSVKMKSSTKNIEIFKTLENYYDTILNELKKGMINNETKES